MRDCLPQQFQFHQEELNNVDFKFTKNLFLRCEIQIWVSLFRKIMLKNKIRLHYQVELLGDKAPLLDYVVWWVHYHHNLNYLFLIHYVKNNWSGMEHNHLRDCPDNPIIVEVNTEHLLYKKELFKKIYTMGSSVNDVTHLGGEGSAKSWHYSIRLICTIDDKG